jgi:hypothetical protein
MNGEGPMQLNRFLLALFIFPPVLAHCDKMDLIDNTKQAPQAPVVAEKEAAEVERVTQFLDRFYADCGRYPTTQEGLRALISKPKTINCKSWGLKTEKGAQPYITSLPKDPWSHWNYTSKNGSNFELTPELH